MQVQLLHYPLAVCVHRLGADHQLLRDLLVGEPFRGQLEDLFLAGGQRLVFAPSAALAPAALEILAEPLLDGGRVEEARAAVSGPYRVHQLAVGGALEDVAGSAYLESLEEVRLLSVDGEHD